MARTWLLNSKGIANKVKNCASLITDCEASRECPRCHYHISNSDVATEWPGFPSGVKFDPSDAELIDHLAAKVGVGSSKPHMFIDEFIPTIDGDTGICYTHPENLPGAKKNGSSFHFFHKTTNAYATGQRKRRKIDKEHNLAADAVRWHKTGKTKDIKGGAYPGCKKIMVLYKSSNKGTKADKANWVMHQYHLGSTEDEKQGEYVVSKIFCQQPKQTDKHDHNLVTEKSESYLPQRSPITPITCPPTTPAPQESSWPVADPDDYVHKSSTKVEEYVPEIFQSAQLQQFEDNMRQPTLLAGESQPDEYLPEVSQCAQLQQLEDNRMSCAPQLDNQLENNMGQPTWLAGESQPAEYHGHCIDENHETLLCNETFSISTLNGPVQNLISNTDYANSTYRVTGNSSTPFGIPDLENLEFDSPPNFQLNGLQFNNSQETSSHDWLDGLL